MNKIMYEINYHSTNDEFTHCTVTPITVMREGLLPGCSGITITAKDSKGRTFQGSPDEYYLTEDDAWNAVRKEITENIWLIELQIKNLQKQLDIHLGFLENMPKSTQISKENQL